MQIILFRLGIASVVVGGLAAGGWWWSQHRSGNDGEETAVRVEPAAVGTLTEIVTAPGEVKPKTAVPISSRVAARVTELPLVVGSIVKKGDPKADPPVEGTVLVRLDAKDLEAALASAKARFAAQESELNVSAARILSQAAQIRAQEASAAEAERVVKRYKDLLATEDVSEAQVTEAEAKFESLKAQVEAAKQGLKADEANVVVLKHQLDAARADVVRAQENVGYATIRSEIDGVVTKVNSEVGETVAPTINNMGTVIMEVADLSEMLVVARVDETSVANLREKQRAIIRLNAYEREVFEGEVKTVPLAITQEKESEQGTKYYKTEILLKLNGRRIQSGLTADVDIETKRHEGVIQVPTQAVIGRNVDELPADVRDRPEVQKSKTITPVVYRLVNGKAVVTPVRIGPSDVTHTIIESGLKPGDPVITGPYKALEKMKHDDKVKDDKAAAPATKPS